MNNIRKRTYVFAIFMVVFFSVLIFFTYYSRVSYFKTLPRVSTVMPERTETYRNGRFLYRIPEQAVIRDEYTGKLFIFTARYYSDVLGERNIVTRIYISVEEKTGEGTNIVDGIVREEPIIIGNIDNLYEGTAVIIYE